MPYARVVTAPGSLTKPRSATVDDVATLRTFNRRAVGPSRMLFEIGTAVATAVVLRRRLGSIPAL